MSKKPNKNLMRRVDKAIGRVFAREARVDYPSLLIELGVLSRKDLEAWRAGRVPYLEKVIQCNITRLCRIQTAVRRIARARGLEPVPGRPPRRHRRYSKYGLPHVEAEYRSVYKPRRQVSSKSAEA